MINLVRSIITNKLSKKTAFSVLVMPADSTIELSHECVILAEKTVLKINTLFGEVVTPNLIGESFEVGEVLIINVPNNTIDRFYRPSATANSILLTEKCDQRCIMCSQPPKDVDYDYFELFKEALMLTPKNTHIGITGGEPTLHKKKLFSFIIDIINLRPDITFHVLSNGQHIKESDIPSLKKINEHVLWGIPLYADGAELHDKIVVKNKAYDKLLKNFNIFYESSSRIELRTVVLRQNISNMHGLAEFISTHLPWIEIWAIMQLENTGYATQHWEEIFFDNSVDFITLGKSLDYMKSVNIKTALYNFPLCTIPKDHRKYALSTISDWKNKYLEDCANCSKKGSCGGFFEWYTKGSGYKIIKPIFSGV